MDRVGFNKFKHKIKNFNLKGEKSMLIKEGKFIQFNDEIRKNGGEVVTNSDSVASKKGAEFMIQQALDHM